MTFETRAHFTKLKEMKDDEDEGVMFHGFRLLLPPPPKTNLRQQCSFQKWFDSNYPDEILPTVTVRPYLSRPS